MQEPELARRRELPIGAEARLGVLDVVEWRVFLVLLGAVYLQELVLGVALGGRTAGVTDQPAQLGWRHELAVAGAGGRGDGLVDEGAAHVVGARRQQALRQ